MIQIDKNIFRFLHIQSLVKIDQISFSDRLEYIYKLKKKRNRRLIGMPLNNFKQI